MSTIELARKIVNEIKESIDSLSESQVNELIKKIKKAKKIYVAGAGRSLLMIRGLAMRLMHMGFEAYVVGETVTPAAEEGDLLIIGSGSGETGSLKIIAEKAKKLGIDLALITVNPDSTIGKLADCIIQVKAAAKSGDKDVKGASIQLGANLFEQTLMILGDTIILRLLDGMNIDNANTELMKKHANLE